MKQIEVTIMGQGYVLGCPEGGEALLTAAVADVDREMCGIRDAGRVKARERIAVLAALNLAYQLAERRAAASAPRALEAAAVSTFDDGSIDLKALVQRIDAVLDQDGHLL
jgi:cell division protein ZapA